jgi:hypothetical protein
VPGEADPGLRVIAEALHVLTSMMDPAAEGRATDPYPSLNPPGQSAWRQGFGLAHGARPGETPRNENLPRRNASKWVIARAIYQRIGDCPDGAPPNGQIA